MSQKYTMGCKVQANSVRARPTSMSAFQPRAAGMTWVGALPAGHRDDHQCAPDPRADHDQYDTDVVERAAGQRRIECVEDGGSTGEDGHVRHHRTEGSERETRPRP